MTKKEFLNTISNGKIDVLQIFLDTITDLDVDYCVIGGLAINAYAEPVVSLDLDIVVAIEELDAVCNAVGNFFKAERSEHSVNPTSDKSDLRIQLQTDSRYQDFISRATAHTILGYDMRVATVEDVLKGKIWAYSDEQIRKSKRQKDLADIARLIEVHPELADNLPDSIRKRID